MKIFYDYQIFEHQEYGGISKYYSELISHISKDKNLSYLLPILKSSNHYLHNVPEIAARLRGGSNYYEDFFFGLEFPGKWKLYQQRNKWLPNFIRANRKNSIRQLKEASYDLFHPTDVDDYFLEHIGNRPFVLTIHDMIDEYFPEYSFHVHSTYKTSAKERLIRNAAGIIAVSNSTKHDILERFRIDEKKIRVIYHGASSLAINPDHPIISGLYFLFVGKRVHYKNFYFLLQALQPFLTKEQSIKLVCVGSPFNNTELAFFRDLKIDTNLVHMLADDNSLGNLYRHARALIYPSLYEGFGIPILEAFQCQCPVIVSNTSSLPEVAGDGAMYFAPKNIGSLQDAFKTILTNDSFREDLISKGSEQLKKFSWSETSKQTFDFYKSIV